MDARSHPAPVIETDRLVLRGFVAEDFDSYAAILAKPEVTRFLGKPVSRAEIWNRVLAGVAQWVLLGRGNWMVERKEDERLIGTVTIFEAKRELGFEGEPEMGWIFDSDVHGQGYALEACRAALNWAEAQLPSSDMWAIIEPGHEASLKLASRLGFSQVEEKTFQDSPIAILKRPAW